MKIRGVLAALVLIAALVVQVVAYTRVSDSVMDGAERLYYVIAGYGHNPLPVGGWDDRVKVEVSMSLMRLRKELSNGLTPLVGLQVVLSALAIGIFFVKPGRGVDAPGPGGAKT